MNCRAAALVLVLLSAAAWAQAPHRHGHGTATITFEGDRIAVALVMPGADIVGFERSPQNPAEEIALAAATNLLRDPVGVLELPTLARCTVAEAELTVEGYVGTTAEHAEFEAAYLYRCADIGKVRVIEFPLFERFPNAQEIEATVVTARGPTRYEVTRAEPRIDRGNFLLRWLMGR